MELEDAFAGDAAGRGADAEVDGPAAVLEGGECGAVVEEVMAGAGVEVRAADGGGAAAERACSRGNEIVEYEGERAAWAVGTRRAGASVRACARERQ